MENQNRDYYAELKAYMMPGIVYQKQELKEYLNVDERTVRRIITKMKRELPIISLSQWSGYCVVDVELLQNIMINRKVRTHADITYLATASEIIEHQINENVSRANEILKANDTLIKQKEELDKWFEANKSNPIVNSVLQVKDEWKENKK